MPVAVGFDEHRRAYADGRPFFLIGARHMPEGGTPSLLAEAGFNAYRALAFGHEVSGPSPLPATDEGILFWAYIYDRAVLSRCSDYRRQLGEYVREARNHPSLLCYENLNEVATCWRNRPPKALPAELEEGTRLLRELDPHHPIWLAHSCERTVETLAQYDGCADILGCNPYPVQPPVLRQHIGVRPDGRMLDCPDQTLHAVGRYTEKMMRVGNGQMPVWMLVQAMANENWFSPAHTPEMAEEGVDESEILYPTREEMRFMAFDAIIAGATGIAFALWKTPVGSQTWQDVTSLVRELNAFSPALTAPPMTGGFGITYADLGFTIWDGVRLMARRRGSSAYLFCANTAFDPARVTIALPACVRSGAAGVEGEDREVPIDKGTIHDDFQPFGVHVYRMLVE